MDRRDFIRVLGYGAGFVAGGGALGKWVAQAATAPAKGAGGMEALAKAAATTATTTISEFRKGDMLYRTLGKTGEKVSVIGVGGAHLGGGSEENATRVMHEAIDHGVTFFDNCWDYARGRCEERMGKALKDGGRRDKVFLMTKLDGRSRAVSSKQLEESLKRLQTDHIDLVQMHEITRPEDIDPMFEKDGAMAVLQEAKKAGKIRYIGFTGHKDPSGHLHMLKQAEKHGVRIDSVQMPLNVMDAHYRSFEHDVLPELVKAQIGVLGMKSLGMGRILNSNTVTAIECLHYAMHLPTSVVITGMDSPERLQQALTAVKTFKPLTKEEVADLLGRTKEVAATGEFEIYKQTQGFDGPASAPGWYGLAS